METLIPYHIQLQRNQLHKVLSQINQNMFKNNLSLSSSSISSATDHSGSSSRSTISARICGTKHNHRQTELINNHLSTIHLIYKTSTSLRNWAEHNRQASCWIEMYCPFLIKISAHLIHGPTQGYKEHKNCNTVKSFTYMLTFTNTGDKSA